MRPGAAGAQLQAECENAPVVPDAAVDRALAPALERRPRPEGAADRHRARHADPAARCRFAARRTLTDALLASVPGTDVALHNSSGDLHANLPGGPLTYGGVYEVMPIDALVVPIRLTGRQLRQVFAGDLERSRRVIGFSGIRVRARCSAGSLDVVLLRPSGIPIRDDEPLLVAIGDFSRPAGTASRFPSPRRGISYDRTAPLARDVLADV